MIDSIKLSDKSDAELKAEYGLTDEEFEEIKDEHLKTMDENGIVYNEDGEEVKNPADLEARIQYYKSPEFIAGQKILEESSASDTIIKRKTKEVILRTDPEASRYSEPIDPDHSMTPEIDQETIDDFNHAMEEYMDDVRKQENKD